MGSDLVICLQATIIMAAFIGAIFAATEIISYSLFRLMCYLAGV